MPRGEGMQSIPALEKYAKYMWVAKTSLVWGSRGRTHGLGETWECKWLREICIIHMLR